MEKKLEYIPIYKGNFNAISEQTMEPEVEIEEEVGDDHINSLDITCWMLTLLCAGYLVIACLR